MEKPENPYKKGTLIFDIMEGDWEDLTVPQIAEVLYASPKLIWKYIRKIENETGYRVSRTKGSPGRKSDE